MAAAQMGSGWALSLSTNPGRCGCRNRRLRPNRTAGRAGPTGSQAAPPPPGLCSVPPRTS